MQVIMWSWHLPVILIVKVTHLNNNNMFKYIISEFERYLQPDKGIIPQMQAQMSQDFTGRTVSMIVSKFFQRE